MASKSYHETNDYEIIMKKLHIILKMKFIW